MDHCSAAARVNLGAKLACKCLARHRNEVPYSIHPLPITSHSSTQHLFPTAGEPNPGPVASCHPAHQAALHRSEILARKEQWYCSPAAKISRSMGNPKPHVLDKVLDPSTLGWTRAVLDPNSNMQGQEGMAPEP